MWNVNKDMNQANSSSINVSFKKIDLKDRNLKKYSTKKTFNTDAVPNYYS